MVQGAQHLIQDPVATIGAVPEAVFSVFGRVSEATKRGGRSKYEDGVAQNLLAVSSFKREYAQKFDIDVYSSNEVLQKELNSVAWAAAAGNLTLGAASMVTGAVVLQVASGVRNLEQAKNIVNALPPTELSRRNREALRQMRVPDSIADRHIWNSRPRSGCAPPQNSPWCTIKRSARCSIARATVVTLASTAAAILVTRPDEFSS